MVSTRSSGIIPAWLDAYLLIENADALHAEYAARGAEFTRPLGDTPWQSREFVVP